MVVSYQSEEGTEFGFVGWPRVFCDRSNLGGRGADSIFVDNVSEEIDLFSSDGTLFGLEVQAMCAEPVEDFTEELHMLFEGCRVDDDVINVDVQAFPNKIVEDLIHDALESGGGIAWSEGHSGEFVLAIWGHKC